MFDNRVDFWKFIAVLAAIFGPILGALVTVAVNALVGSNNAKKMRRVSLFESIMRNMGSSSPETIAEYRRIVKRVFIERDKDGRFKAIRRKSDIRNEYKRSKKIFSGLSDKVKLDNWDEVYERLREIVLSLSANFNRACAVTISALDKDLTMNVIHLLGDAFMDYWAICFEAIREQQKNREDEDNRMHLEYMAYLSFKVFLKEKRTCETFGLYDGTHCSNPEIRKHMVKQIKEKGKELEKKSALKKFAKKCWAKPPKV